jgi:hypothetical protein
MPLFTVLVLAFTVVNVIILKKEKRTPRYPVVAITQNAETAAAASNQQSRDLTAELEGFQLPPAALPSPPLSRLDSHSPTLLVASSSASSATASVSMDDYTLCGLLECRRVQKARKLVNTQACHSASWPSIPQLNRRRRSPTRAFANKSSDSADLSSLPQSIVSPSNSTAETRSSESEYDASAASPPSSSTDSSSEGEAFSPQLANRSAIEMETESEPDSNEEDSQPRERNAKQKIPKTPPYQRRDDKTKSVQMPRSLSSGAIKRAVSFSPAVEVRLID